MTTTLELLHDLHKAGIRLSVSGENLAAKPADAVTDDLAAMIRARKPQLLKILGGPTTPCEHCGGKVVRDRTHDDYWCRFCCSCGRWLRGEKEVSK